MADHLSVIRSVMAEHQLLAEDVRRVRDSANDVEGAFALDTASSEWSQGAPEMLAEKQQRLTGNLGALAVKLARHFQFEEEFLPPVFGEQLMRALVTDHRDIASRIRDCELVLTTVRLSGLKRTDALAKKAGVLQTIVDARQAMSEHVEREEVILKMLERSLQG